MAYEDARLRIECLLRRAGLGGLPTPALACMAVLLVALVVVALWQFWPASASQDTFAYQSATQASADGGSVQAGENGAGTANSQDTASAQDAANTQNVAGAASAQSGDATSNAQPAAGAAGTQGGSGAAEPAATSGSIAAQYEIRVDVEGAVKKPGLYTFAQGTRVGDAIERAGGMKASAAKGAINLAQVLDDGVQVYVPTKAEARAQGTGGSAQGATAGSSGSGAVGSAASGASAGAQTGGSADKVNLNTATLEQLQTLPGVGPVLAQSIVDYREQTGPFGSVEDLKKVSGIGDTRFARLKDSVCV